MTSLASMLTRLQGLLGTRDLNAWEEEFVAAVWQRSGEAKNTTALTAAQADKVAEIFARHFAG